MADRNIKIEDFGCMPFVLLGIMVALSMIGAAISDVAGAIDNLTVAIQQRGER